MLNKNEIRNKRREETQLTYLGLTVPGSLALMVYVISDRAGTSTKKVMSNIVCDTSDLRKTGST